MGKDYLAEQAAPDDAGEWVGDGSKGAPRKWPFLEMEVGSIFKVHESDAFASARAAVMYAKKTKGLRLRTKVKSGVLYVKRFP